MLKTDVYEVKCIPVSQLFKLRIYTGLECQVSSLRLQKSWLEYDFVDHTTFSNMGDEISWHFAK